MGAPVASFESDQEKDRGSALVGLSCLPSSVRREWLRAINQQQALYHKNMLKYAREHKGVDVRKTRAISTTNTTAGSY
jgi:hypothetical protein